MHPAMSYVTHWLIVTPVFVVILAYQPARTPELIRELCDIGVWISHLIPIAAHSVILNKDAVWRLG